MTGDSEDARESIAGEGRDGEKRVTVTARAAERRVPRGAGTM